MPTAHSRELLGDAISFFSEIQLKAILKHFQTPVSRWESFFPFSVLRYDTSFLYWLKILQDQAYFRELINPQSVSLGRLVKLFLCWGHYLLQAMVPAFTHLPQQCWASVLGVGFIFILILCFMSPFFPTPKGHSVVPLNCYVFCYPTFLVLSHQSHSYLQRSNISLNITTWSSEDCWPWHLLTLWFQMLTQLFNSISVHIFWMNSPSC